MGLSRLFSRKRRNSRVIKQRACSKKGRKGGGRLCGKADHL